MTTTTYISPSAAQPVLWKERQQPIPAGPWMHLLSPRLTLLCCPRQGTHFPLQAGLLCIAPGVFSAPSVRAAPSKVRAILQVCVFGVPTQNVTDSSCLHWHWARLLINDVIWGISLPNFSPHAGSQWHSLTPPFFLTTMPNVFLQKVKRERENSSADQSLLLLTFHSLPSHHSVLFFPFFPSLLSHSGLYHAFQIGFPFPFSSFSPLLFSFPSILLYN